VSVLSQKLSRKLKVSNASQAFKDLLYKVKFKETDYSGKI
jgi:hypothetical protein